jgi:hypothetical protein
MHFGSSGNQNSTASDGLISSSAAGIRSENPSRRTPAAEAKSGRYDPFETEKDRIFVERSLDAAMFVVYLSLVLSQLGCLNPPWAGEIAASELASTK